MSSLIYLGRSNLKTFKQSEIEFEEKLSEYREKTQHPLSKNENSGEVEVDLVYERDEYLFKNIGLTKFREESF